MKALVTGACGQLGFDLINSLALLGFSVVATQRSTAPHPDLRDLATFVSCDVTSRESVAEVCAAHKPTHVFHLAALLSGVGEQRPSTCWDVNVNGLINVLDACRHISGVRVCVPSSIAVFGANVDKVAGQHVPLQPTTMYGITKVAGEQLCAYYRNKYDLDVRGVRLPGIVSATECGGGTTDWAVEMLKAAVHNEPYACFVREHTKLPLMHIDDCVSALIDVTLDDGAMRADYNVHGFTASPHDVCRAVRVKHSDFVCTYKPDHRDAIAESWIDGMKDGPARADWGWMPSHDCVSTVNSIMAAFAAQLPVEQADAE